jgi:deazaflavin-dependent oxidoreductase (nitroreductase family)
MTGAVLTSDPNEWNRRIIEEFRANDGKVGGNFENLTLVLLHTTGRKSGAQRINPLAANVLDDGRVVVFGSKAGATTHPDWYYNVLADPEVTIEIGTETRAVRAYTAEGDERAAIWEPWKQVAPVFSEYEESAGDREIPVVVLEPR